jgi:magnesium chelatase family protein
MPLAVVRSRALVALDAPEVRVEVHLGNGLPAFHIVGMPQTAVRESADRVRAALLHCGFEFPNRRLTVNLAPADLPKDSCRFDLPIAIGILAASGQVPCEPLDELEFVGELSLTGELRPIRGALAMLLALQQAGCKRRLVLPVPCRTEAALASEACALVATDLPEVCSHLRGDSALERVDPSRPAFDAVTGPDLADVKGQRLARRALEVAAAGAHSLLMVGSPGAGKTMLAQRFGGLLPRMTDEQALACAAVQSIANGVDPGAWGRRPFRSPHHSASGVALVGGGNPPRPGEVSLAHEGVLFLDELPEFKASVLEALREPIESGEITISRAARQATFPARFQLITAMNPCPCGYAGSRLRECVCTPDRIARYQQRISGPLLDRIDLRIEVDPVPPEDLADTTPGEPAATVRARVERARARQTDRQGCPNALLAPREIDRHCSPSESAGALLRQAAGRLGWSARAYHRVLRVARTLADLEGAEHVGEAHVAEAVQYRRALPGH